MPGGRRYAIQHLAPADGIHADRLAGLDSRPQNGLNHGSTERIQSMSKSGSGTPASSTPKNPSAGLQGLLLLDVWVRTVIWCLALTATVLVVRYTQPRALSWDNLLTFGGAWAFSITIMNFILLFNVAYILALVIIRLPLPSPERGVIRTEGATPKGVVLAAFLAVLTKARYHPPFPAVFVPQLA